MRFPSCRFVVSCAGLLLGLFFKADASACIIFLEEDRIKSTPSQAPVPVTIAEVLQQHENRGVWEGRVAELRQTAAKQWDFRTQNNLSAALAHTGRLDEALERMQMVERTYPGQRETASNLGTVYELKGDLRQAKLWIAEGIKREEKAVGYASINGTEWLHLRILDAKMGLRRDPRFLDSYAVSGLDFGVSRLPVTPISYPQGNNGALLGLSGVQKALQEQLHERLEFVKAPDALIGQLLFDLGNALAVSKREEDARDIYRLALDFSPLSVAMLQSRFDYFAGTPNYALQGGLWSLVLGTIAC